LKRLIVVSAALALAGLALAACNPAFGVRTNQVIASQRPATSSEIDKILNAARDYLVDPYSVRDAEISNVINLGGTPVVCVKFNAKNRMGGYTGRQTLMIYMNQNGQPYMANQASYSVAGCNALRYRRFNEAERLHDL
jgi:predicted small secreted protein